MGTEEHSAETMVGGRTISQLLTLHGNRSGVELRAGDATSPSIPGNAEELTAITGSLAGSASYQVEGVLARGGMGKVLRVQDLNCRRKVAMKVMLEEDCEDSVRLVRFVEEAQITAQLEHPNIVPVHELGIDEQRRVFYTMKQVQGKSLREVLEGVGKGDKETIAAYPLSELLRVFLKVCDAIAFAHSRSVIHRDLKPDNVMLGDFGEVLVVDWGVAKLLGRETLSESILGTMPAVDEAVAIDSVRQSQESGAFQTMAGAVVGTPRYMAPEQASGNPEVLDQRADVYGLGAILYAILTLRPPISGSSEDEVLEKASRGEVTAFDAYNEESFKATGSSAAGGGIRLAHLPEGRVPASLAAVAMKALATSPRDRYRDAVSLQRDVAAYLDGFATSAENARFWRLLKLYLVRNRATVGIATALLVIFLGLAAGLTWIYVGEVKKREAIAVSERFEAEVARAAAVESRERAQAISRRAAPEQILNVRRHLAGWDGSQAWDQALIATGLDSENAVAWFCRGRAALLQEDLGAAKIAFEQSRALATEAMPEKKQSERYLRYLERRDPDFVAEMKDPILTWLDLKNGGDAQAIIASLREQLIADNPGLQLDRTTITSNEDGTLEMECVAGGKLQSLEALRGFPIRKLRVMKTLVRDLGPLQGMPLVDLEIEGSRVVDLEPLRGMPLNRLEVSQTKLVDLGPLTGMPITILNLNVTEVSDLRPLRGMPLKWLSIACRKLSDLRPLVGMPLRDLSLIGTGISDLSLLAGMPLERLMIGKTEVTDLSPLKGVPLEFLAIDRTPVSDLTPLIGSSVRVLNIGGTAIGDLRVLMEMTSLREILVTADAFDADIGFLKAHATLEAISIGPDRIPVIRFWQDYEADHARQP